MAIRTQSGQRLRRFTLTLNNYTDEEYEKMKENMQTYCQWAVIGKEVGSEGTKHLQAAACLNKQQSFSSVKTLFPKCHIEVMRGSPQQNLEYCTKEDHEAWVHGQFPSPGKRTDLDEVATMVVEGASIFDIAQSHPTSVIKYSRGLSVLRSYCTGKRTPDKPPCIVWIYGSTGTGKTREAWAYGCSTFGENQTLILPDQTLQWFDGYDGQRCVIIDDFRSKKVNFAFLLRVLDRYPLACPIKGGYVNWTPDTIIITTPYDPERTFEHRYQHIPEDIRQLVRRITLCIQFPLGNGRQLGSIISASIHDTATDPRRQQLGSGNGTPSPIQPNSGNRIPTVGTSLSSSQHISLVRQDATVSQCVSCLECVTEVNPRRLCKECSKTKDK